MLRHRRLDPADAVLGAGVEHALRPDHTGQARRPCGDRVRVDHRPDVAAALADDDPDPRELAADVALRRKLALARERRPRRRQQPRYGGRSSRPVGHGFRDILGLPEGATGEDAGPARRGGVKLPCPHVSVLVELDRDAAGALLGLHRGTETDGQDHQVEPLLGHRPPGQPIADAEVAALRHPSNGRNHRADVPHPVFLLGALDVAFEFLAVGPQVHVENRGLQPRNVFLGDDGLLGGIHAADR